ncbi:hypothetical protein C8J56DRAFT_1158677 [Mycena floridula]|nr:hypothetical protein C8J56DRAFT_1158677 [Mycena floridula]
MSCFLLPSHPSLTSVDPLGTCDEESPTVWAVFKATISELSSIWKLPDVVQNLAYSLHGNGSADTAFLQQIILETFINATDGDALLSEIIRSAIALPDLFASHTIPYLNADNPVLTLSRIQVKSLIAHQLLGTMKPPENNTWGCTFLCWYSGAQPMEEAVKGYIMTLFHYFQRPVDETLIKYEFCRSNVDPNVQSSAPLFQGLDLVAVNPVTDQFPSSSTCYLVSSNSSPGFGASVTQEEVITAACPELLPLGALCIVPPVPAEAALIAEGIIPMTSWKGHRRDARLVGPVSGRAHYTFLLIDAAELDTLTSSTMSLVDLDPTIFLRDLRKAFIGFAALRQRGISQIFSPVWGSGAFGADPIIKTLILAMAGSLAGLAVGGNGEGHESLSILYLQQRLFTIEMARM